MNYQPRVWSLQEAKAKFSEVVRLAQSEGPQLVTVHGQPAVTISKSEPEQKKLSGLTGLDMVNAWRTGPFIDIELPPREQDGQMRDIELPDGTIA
jgi:antitoxin Phd